MKKEKIPPQSLDEFISGVAEDCITNLSDTDRLYLCDNPCSIDYHFGYAMYIRNHYIHNKDFSEVDFWVEPDDLSGKIMNRIFSLLLPNEFFYEDLFIEQLFWHKEYIRLRKAYRLKYGEYPVELEMKYHDQAPISTSVFDTLTTQEFFNLPKDYDAAADLEQSKKDREIRSALIDRLIRELSAIIWNLEEVYDYAAEYHIPSEQIRSRVEEVKSLFFDQKEYVPMASVLIPYSDQIDATKYEEIRTEFCQVLDEHPRLVEKISNVYFHDPVIAKTALKHGYAMKYLPEYQNDDEMVRYALEKDGSAIEFVNERFVRDRKWVKIAIEHSEHDTIMFHECMSPFRKDKEFVYLACKIHRWNFAYVDEAFHDDYDLAKIVLAPPGDLNNIFHYLSERLRDDLSLALLDAQGEYPNVKEYSERLRDNEEVAEMLIKTHGHDSWRIEDMSDRIKEKYNYKRNRG